MSNDLFDWNEWRKQEEAMNERQRCHATRRRIGRGWLRNSRAEGGLISCPNCARSIRADQCAVSREADRNGAKFIDVGFKCPNCKSEFGFELSGPKIAT